MQWSWRHTWIPGALLLLLRVSTVWATPYQLQIAHVEEKLFLRYVETGGNLFHVARHVLPRLQEALDQATLSSAALLPDRNVQPIIPAKDRSGRLEAVTARLTPPQPSNPWMVVAWEGTPGKTVVFQVSSQQVHYQELIEVAVDIDGVLQRLPVSGVPLFGRRQVAVPAFASTYIMYTLERGLLVTKMAQYAESFDGLSVLIGRNHNLYYPDFVYLMVQMPAEAKTYKVVLAWRDRETLRDGHGNDSGAFGNN
jgi:hypothetical protein